MKNLILLPAVFCITLFASCSASKKLQTENDQLKAKNTELTNQVNDLQNQVTTLTASNKSMSDEYKTYKTNCEATKAKLNAVQNNLEEQLKILQEVQRKVDAAVVNFKDKGVDVFYKDGFVHVQMRDALLFKSGSSTLDPKGKEALGQLASVLNDYPKLPVYVVGNTDNVQFKSGSDNWSLSTERANSVVRVLMNDYKVDPTRLVAAGRGKYNPIADNSTSDGKSANRRIDIVLNPDLKMIWESTELEMK